MATSDDNNDNAGTPQTPEGFRPAGAAILAPPTAFQGGALPPGAMVMIPLGPDGEPLPKSLVDGPVALTQEQMWKLLGFNGPAVQVQDQEGRPILIGVEDLLKALEEAHKADPQDTNKARVFALELMKHERHEKAEMILGKVVARGGDADDWLRLGIVQTNLKKFDKAEGTLKGAANLAKESPVPLLHLSKVYEEKKDGAKQEETLRKAIDLAGNFLDAWVGLFNYLKEAKGEAEAEKAIEELAATEKQKKYAAPYIALQAMYVNEEATREKALTFAKKAVERDINDPMSLLSLSSIYGQMAKLDEVEKLLRPHESKMLTDVRLANNYFEALWQSRQIEKVTRFLNTLVRAENAQVKQFAQERAQGIARFLQQLQQQASGAAIKS
jgi:tetratricopeptide (TPR) repeat protein